jgi:hypothetical protein
VLPVSLWTAGVLVGVWLLLRSPRLPSPGRLALAAMIAAVLLATTFASLDRQARLQLSTVRAQAGVTALAVAPPRVPDRLNAALVYQQAWEAAGRFEDLPEGWPDWIDWIRGEEIPARPVSPDDPDLRAFLAAQPVLDLLRRAATMPDCSFERDWGFPGFDLPLPELSSLRISGQLLRLDARCRAADGQVAGALEDLRAIQGLAEHCRTEPVLISALVAMATQSMAIDELETLLATGRVTAADLETLQLAPGTPWLRTMRRCFRMEEASGLGCFSLLAGTGGLAGLGLEGTGAPMAGPGLALWRVLFMQAELQEYRFTMARYQQALDGGYQAAHVQASALRRELETGPSGLMTRMLLPALDTVVERAWIAEARHQLARVAVALVAYQEGHGTPPERLEDLVPEHLDAVPEDPFTGEPVRMTLQEDGILLRCEGPPHGEEDGILFRLPR